MYPLRRYWWSWWSWRSWYEFSCVPSRGKLLPELSQSYQYLFPGHRYRLCLNHHFLSDVIWLTHVCRDTILLKRNGFINGPVGVATTRSLNVRASTPSFFSKTVDFTRFPSIISLITRAVILSLRIRLGDKLTVTTNSAPETEGMLLCHLTIGTKISATARSHQIL